MVGQELSGMVFPVKSPILYNQAEFVCILTTNLVCNLQETIYCSMTLN